MAGFDLTFDPPSSGGTPKKDTSKGVQASRDRLMARRADLAATERTYRAAGYHCSADVLADRIEVIDWQLGMLSREPLPVPAPGVNLGKDLVTPSIQSQFETPTPKSASV